MSTNCLQCERLTLRRGKAYCGRSEQYMNEEDLFWGECDGFRPVPENCNECGYFTYADLEDDDGDIIEKDCPFCEDVGDYLTGVDYEREKPRWCDYSENLRREVLDIKIDHSPSKEVMSLKKKLEEKYWVVQRLA